MKRQLKNLIVPAYIIECNTRRQLLCANIIDFDNRTEHYDIKGVKTLSNQSRRANCIFSNKFFSFLYRQGVAPLVFRVAGVPFNPNKCHIVHFE